MHRPLDKYTPQISQNCFLGDVFFLPSFVILFPSKAEKMVLEADPNTLEIAE